MLDHKCSECGKRLPKGWKPIGVRSCQPVCPECAVKHMKRSSARKKRMALSQGQRKEA